MAYKIFSIFSIMIVLSLVYRSSAIYCLSCNSAGINGSACLDPLNVDEETRRIIPIVNCEEGVTRNDLSFFCRKIHQTIYLKGEAEVRVTRGCGWVRNEQPCYHTKTVDYTETSCQCFEDKCNSADSFEPSTITAIFVAFSACLYFYR